MTRSRFRLVPHVVSGSVGAARWRHLGLAALAVAVIAAALSPLAVLTAARAAQAGAVGAGQSPVAAVRVPADRPTVQAGIDAVAPGGRVVVAPGTYHERIDFHGKAVEVASLEGPQVTILDGGHNGTVVTFSSGEGRASVLRGFTVRNGQSSGISISNASPTVTGNVVSGNSNASSGGGIAVSFGSPLLEANRVTGNGQTGGAGGYGGGISIEGAGAAQVVGNTIDHNSWGSDGGAIGINGGNAASLKDNVIRDNAVPSLGGAIYMLNGSDVTVVDNLFAGNSAGLQGGAAYVHVNGSSGPFFVGNTMVANRAAEGSALYFEDLSLAGIVVANNVMVGPAGGVVACHPRRGMFAVPHFSHNDTYDGTRLPYAGCGNPTGLSGNISADPRFVDPATTPGDYRLRAGSPAVDAGDNLAPSLPAADLLGEHRITDGDGDGVGIVDIGAYEISSSYGSPPGPAPPDPAPPMTVQVPSAQPTIQAGIDRVAPGGFVVVAPGTYPENIDFHGKAVTVEAATDAAPTVIDGGGKDTVVSFVSREGRTSVLQGFTIRDGGGEGEGLGGGIDVSQASPSIVANNISHNLGTIGVGIHVFGGGPVIRGNEISDNHAIPGTSGGFGGGISLAADAPAEVSRNTIEDNSDDTGGGLSVSGTGAVIRDNVIRRNRSINEAGGVRLDAEDITFVQNVVADNATGNRGGGMYGILRSVQGAFVVNNTFAGNHSARGSAIWAEGFEPGVVLENNVISGPTATTVLECDDPGWSNLPAIPQFSHNDIYNGDAQPMAGCGTVVGQHANVSSNPRFVEASPLAPDYHLQGTSPLIDAGANDAPAVPIAELDGRPFRVTDGDGDGTATIDIGAFEAPAAAWRATASSWGWNAYGQLGGGTSAATRVSPGPEVAVRAVVDESAGLLHTLVLQADRTVRAAGWNGVGQLGDGTTANRSVPVTVVGLTDVVEVAAGGAHSLALRSDGTVWSWGWNAYGQLGDGTTVNRAAPVQVIGLTGVTAVSAGTYHSLALKADGTLWAWGFNAYGEIGDGTTADRHVPVQVPGVAGATSVAAGGLHSVAATATGNVWAWGWNGVGQLGTASTTDSRLPTMLSGMTGVVGVSAGLHHSMAVNADGTAWAWGWNAYGQLGDATTVDRHAPVQVATGAGRVRRVAAGSYHSLFLRDDGRVQSVGWNGVGQLGDNSTLDRHVPVVVPGLLGVSAISAGGYHSVGY